jgi:hypothetical protein
MTGTSEAVLKRYMGTPKKIKNDDDDSESSRKSEVDVEGRQLKRIVTRKGLLQEKKIVWKGNVPPFVAT